MCVRSEEARVSIVEVFIKRQELEALELKILTRILRALFVIIAFWLSPVFTGCYK